MDPAIVSKQRGDIELFIGKQKFSLERSMGNIDAVESVLKKTYAQLLEQLGNKQLLLTAQEFSMFVFVTQKDPKLTYNAIRKLVYDHGTTSIVPAIAQFVNTAISGAVDPVEEVGTGNE